MKSTIVSIIVASFSFIFFSESARPDDVCMITKHGSAGLVSEQVQTHQALRQSFENTGNKLKIPVYAHRFLSTCFGSTYTATEEQINTEITATNQIYDDVNFNIELVLIDILEHVSDSAHIGTLLCSQGGYLDATYDADFMDRYGIPGAINLFCVQGPSAQHANFPTDSANVRNVVVLKFYDDGWSTLHELGHTFHLLHTWNDDHVADTEPTVNLSFMNPQVVTPVPSDCDISNDCNCEYVWTDPNQTLTLNSGVWKNIMNYGVRSCARVFTPGQVDRMWSGLMRKINQDDFDFCLLPGFGNCPPSVFLSSNENERKFITADQTIISNQIINSPDSISIYQAKQVLLTPGFRAVSGTHLNIRSNPDFCDCSN